MKKILTLILFLLFATPVFAGNNLTINCNSSGCDKVQDLPIFSENNIYPSFITSQSLTVNNNRQSKCQLNFNASNPQNSDSALLDQLQLSVVADQYPWYSSNFSYLFNSDLHSLGEINSQSNKIYTLTASLSPELGNELQNLSANFSLNFNFTCDDEPNSSTSSSTAASTPDTVCHDNSPSQIPQNLKAVAGQNSVTLTWDEPTDNFTYYLIAYSTNDTADTYGNPNVGSKGTKSYTVKDLSAGTKYYFKIRTGNGCAPGPFSTIVSATPGGQVLTNTTPAGFQPNVLGVQTTGNTAPLGATSTCTPVIPFAFALALLVNLILNRFRLFTFFVSSLSLIFDYFINRYTCVKHPYFYLANLVSFLLPLLISFRKNKK